MAWWQPFSMSTTSLYTDRTEEPRPRVREEISANVWRGLVGLIGRRIDNGSLAEEFPSHDCPDSSGAITGTDRAAFEAALGGLVPALRTMPRPPQVELDPTPLLDPRAVPPTPVALDVIDFVSRYIAEPTSRSPHGWGRCYEHLWFNENSREQGQDKFREDVEQIFSRNGIAFTIGHDMKVVRLGPPEARALLNDFATDTGDSKLDELLGDAQTRFLSRDPQNGVVALEKLWKAFERLKNMEALDKKASIRHLLARAAKGNSAFEAHLNAECAELTKIGNTFHIRHSEHDQQPLPAPTQTSIDYLFTRVLSLIAYLLRQTGRM
jgi:hypothetical protein